MKAKIYKIKVCEGVMDFVHGDEYEITELAVLEWKFGINEQACFVIDDDEEPIEERIAAGTEIQEIDLTPEQVETLTKLRDNLVERKALETQARELLA